MRWSAGIQLVVVAVAATTLSCTGRAEAPSAAPAGSDEVTGSSPGTATPPEVTTRSTISSVAGRLDDRKRKRVKVVVERVVDDYLDGGFVAGPYPRDDFTAALADFREGAAADATTALDQLTNSDIGADVTGVTARHRRLRIDVLAPGGRPSAATARFVLRLDVQAATDPAGPTSTPTSTSTSTGPTPTPTPVPSTRKVVGSLFLTNQEGAWQVFGYVVRKVDS